jgi:acetyltransferase-like isoleucine patch superfamily enzyme
MYFVAICKKNNGNTIKNKIIEIREKDEGRYFVGENCDIRGKEKISFGDGVFVQENCGINIAYDNPLQDIIIDIKKEANIGRRSIITASNKVVIGEKVLIAPNVYIADCGHEFSDINMPIIEQGISGCTNEVIIGSGTWIGTNSVIVGNVNIGVDCVIGANSFVNKDIPDYSVAVGSPAKIIKMFDTIDNEWKVASNESEIEKILKRRENTDI